VAKRAGKLSVSILGADLARLADQVKLVEPYADLIHVDVMDAHFVPPLTFGAVVVSSLRRHTGLILDGHLMVDSPASLFDDLAEAGMDRVTFHVESVDDAEPVIRKARGAGMGVGMTMGPETPVETLYPYLEDLDDVIVMSVNPGWAGQGFLPESLPKLEAMRGELDRRGIGIDLQIDGGVKADNARRCVEAGATVLVVSTAIYDAERIPDAAAEFAAIVKEAG
jgi:ribulose-phosphate 3-epimerase